jgi:hypothetical protein
MFNRYVHGLATRALPDRQFYVQRVQEGYQQASIIKSFTDEKSLIE